MRIGTVTSICAYFGLAPYLFFVKKNMLARLLQDVKRLLLRCKLRLYLLLSRPFFCEPPDVYEPNVYFFRFGIPLVLKRTCRTVSTEADALRFLNRATPTSPIPKLIDSFQVDGATYTLMTKLPGRPLLKMDELSPKELSLVTGDILTILDELWRIPQPMSLASQVMSSASGHGLPHPVFFREEIAGPYGSTIDCYESMQINTSKQSPEVLKPIIDDAIVWVHTDLTMRNVLIENGRVSGIIDWEDAGWLPRHWLLHILRRPRPGCQGIWVRFWINDYRFDPAIEDAYNASKTMIIYPFS
ncbi:hypothetical protein A0H81_10490 [Grifola frondosa]|uniref:Aminoglycoside phosphotransferase domain-containing protein n=1 Tax=Grifola frondosa TaxID=5627 RepID=A0A1C7M376_GRIFR|nr:hypothetical protein A0H81_10490 [Grifola frondosa]